MPNSWADKIDIGHDVIGTHDFSHRLSTENSEKLRKQAPVWIGRFYCWHDIRVMGERA
jgi:hypothetical protein